MIYFDIVRYPKGKRVKRIERQLEAEKYARRYSTYEAPLQIVKVTEQPQGVFRGGA